MRIGLVKAFTITALLLAALMFLTSDTAYKTAARAHNFLFPSYKQEMLSHVVRSGDTLYGIAAKYAGKQDKWNDLRGIVDDIENVNNLQGTKKMLKPGQRIVIPLYKEI